jgi:hypothetical protein
MAPVTNLMGYSADEEIALVANDLEPVVNVMNFFFFVTDVEA